MPWIVMAGGAAIILFALGNWIRRRLRYEAATHRWSKDEAVVVAAGYVRSENTPEPIIRPLTIAYRFRDAGGGDRDGSQSAPLGPGGIPAPQVAQQWVSTFVPRRTVPVWYDPARPSDSLVWLDPSGVGSVVIWIAFGIVFIGFGWMILTVFP